MEAARLSTHVRRARSRPLCAESAAHGRRQGWCRLLPGDSPYIATVRVEKRENVPCMGRDWPALRLSLNVRQLEVEGKKPTKAVPYAKFRSGTIWVSRIALRIPLRAEVQVFIGYVYGELQSYGDL